MDENESEIYWKFPTNLFMNQAEGNMTKHPQVITRTPSGTYENTKGAYIYKYKYKYK